MMSRLNGAWEAGPIRSPAGVPGGSGSLLDVSRPPFKTRRRSVVLTNFTNQNHESRMAARGGAPRLAGFTLFASRLT